METSFLIGYLLAYCDTYHARRPSNKGNGTFQEPNLVVQDFGYDDEAGGWRVSEHPRFVADVNNDDRADIVGFGNAGVFVALSRLGGTFEKPQLVIKDFSSNQGWSVDMHPRLPSAFLTLGRPWIVGFGNHGVSIAQIHL